MAEKKGLKKEQKKTLWNILVIIGILIIGFILTFIILNKSGGSFIYRGVNFTTVNFCDAGPPCLITYNTKIPIIYEGKPANYNFYIRNDPRDLEKEVPFYGDLLIKDEMNLEITYNTSCEGYEKIALENFLNLHGVAGINISSQENVSCDLSGNEMNILISDANKTEIRQLGPACYRIDIKGCEIIKGTERFMLETFVKIKEM